MGRHLSHISHKSYKPGRIAGIEGNAGARVVSVACTDTPRSLGEIPNMRYARTWYLPRSRGVVYR